MKTDGHKVVNTVVKGAAGVGVTWTILELVGRLGSSNPVLFTCQLLGGALLSLAAEDVVFKQVDKSDEAITELAKVLKERYGVN